MKQAHQIPTVQFSVEGANTNDNLDTSYEYWINKDNIDRSWSRDSSSSDSSNNEECYGSPGSYNAHHQWNNQRQIWQPPRSTSRKNPGSPPRKVPTWSPDRCVSMDAEMVGVGPYGLDSSVAHVVILDWEGSVLFDEYIKQTQVVTDYRTFISGISPEHLENAELSLRDARKSILKILYGRILIGHGLKNDLKSLGISHPWWLTRDSARYEPFMQSFGEDKTLWPRKLKELAADLLGEEIQVYGKPHSPHVDAITALKLYKTVQNKWEQVMRKKVEKTNGILTGERNYHKRLAKQQRQQQQYHCQQQFMGQSMWAGHPRAYFGGQQSRMVWMPQGGQGMRYSQAVAMGTPSPYRNDSH
eukprot:Nitzschia sp. Nitz4//scaffold365_size14809//2537//3689//NITZ4_008913-RA/size14809-snap-gene-0.8-mRNA-1//1//CDS//3329549286//4935//frame0